LRHRTTCWILVVKSEKMSLCKAFIFYIVEKMAEKGD